MLGTVSIWGINFSVVKLALDEFSPMAFNAVRFSLATAIMLVMLRLRSRSAEVPQEFRVSRRDLFPVILLGLVGHALYQLLFINGLARTAPANSSLLIGTSPIWVAIIGYLLRIERINRLMAAGILLSFIGIAVLITGGGGRISLGGATMAGDLMLLGSAILWATYTTASKPLLVRHSPLKLTTWTMVAGAVPLTILGIPDLLRQDWRAVTVGAWGALLFSALFALVASYLVWYTSVQRVGNARTAVYSNLIPVVAIVFAWLALGSRLLPQQAVGAAVVLAGLMVTRRGRMR